MLWNEARELLLDEGEKLEDNLDCIVSIGTGVSRIEEFGESLKDVAKSLVAIATETETTANRFYEDHGDIVNDDRYCRLNVQNGLEGVGLEEHQKNNFIIAVTNGYLDSPGVKRQMQKFVRRAKEHEGVLNLR